MDEDAQPPPVQPDMLGGVPRPREGDPGIVRAAALALAAAMRREVPDYLEDQSDEEFALHVAQAHPFADGDGAGIARDMERLHHYAFDRAAVEVYDRWGEELRAAHGERVRAWIAANDPRPPFEDVARVRTVAGHPEGEGVAYRDARQDALAECLLVTDEDRGRFVGAKAFTGGYVVPWENVEVIGPASPEDVALLAGRRAEDGLHERRRAFQAGVERRYRDAVEDARAEALAMDDDALRAYAQAALDGLALAVDDEGFDAHGTAAAQAAAAMAEMRERARRKACEAP